MRAATRKFVQQISDEIRAAQHSRPQDERRDRGILALLTLPDLLRQLA